MLSLHMADKFRYCLEGRLTLWTNLARQFALVQLTVSNQTRHSVKFSIACWTDLCSLQNRAVTLVDKLEVVKGSLLPLQTICIYRAEGRAHMQSFSDPLTHCKEVLNGRPLHNVLGVGVVCFVRSSFYAKSCIRSVLHKCESCILCIHSLVHTLDIH